MTDLASMQYISISAPGEPEVLELVSGPAPVAAPGQLLIRVAAAGVNRPDILQRRGLYRVPPNASPIPGLEVSGEVVAVGEGTRIFSVGDRVCALANGGGYAQLVAIPEGQCLPIPEGLSDIEAAALPETFFTVWANVVDMGRLTAGETFLVHGGSSGIGTTAIALAKALGARVFTTAGSAEKCAACIDLGAELAVNYKEQDFVEELTAATDGKGIDVTLDMVGGDYLARNAMVAARDGRIVIIASLRGKRAELDIGTVMMKRLVITGSLLRPRSDAQKAAIAASLKRTVWPLIEAGQIRPVIDSVFPLADAPLAHRLMESSEHIGKIVLDVRAAQPA